MTAFRRIHLNPWWWIGAGLALTAAKLWLSRGQGVYAIADAGHDDLLFVQLAGHLARGEWLGPYNELTLAKGPFYSLFMAGAFLLGVPLFLAQHLLYAGACAAFVRALRPAVASAALRLTVFALLLWNPMTYEAPAMGRVLRQHVQGPLALLVVAGLIGLYLRRDDAWKRQWPWAVTVGLGGGAFYLTREDGVWLLPAILLLGGTWIWSAWRTGGTGRRRALAMLGVAAIGAVMPVSIVSLQNLRHYGWFGTVEFRAKEFKAAYGAMLRVEAGPVLPFVPVTREARAAMAAVSPAFASLQEQFDQGLARGWAENSSFLTGQPTEAEQIGGGWLMWAVREAAMKAGHHRDAAHALQFYDQLARELNEACDQGLLPAGPRRHGFMPKWRPDLTGQFIHTVSHFSDFVLRFSRFSARPPPSTGSPENLQLFRDITRERLSPPEGELDVVGAARYLLNLRKVEWLQSTGKTLRPLLLWLGLLSAGLFVLRTVQAVLVRRWSYSLTVAAAAGSAVAGSVFLHAMVEVTAFPVLTVSSFAPIYPLLLAFIAAMLLDATQVGTWLRHASPKSLPEPEAIGMPAVPPRLRKLLPWLPAVAALAPFVIWHHEFRKLIWFGDDFLLVEQIGAMGVWPWSLQVFSENFVPLFKVLWGQALLLGNGSYLVMLWLLWLTHAANTVLLGRLLQRAGFPWPATVITVVLFALTPANLETLGWSVQWSAVLAMLFLLLGLWWHERAAAGPGLAWRTAVVLALLSAASALSFSRGVLTGAVLALALVLPALRAGSLFPTWRRTGQAALCLLPAVIVALVIKSHSAGNHQSLAGQWGDVLEFGASYFLFNPGHALLGGSSLHPIVLVLLAAAKIGLLLGGLMISRDRVRNLLWVLLAYDLGCALLVGVGRHHTGFLAALSSRYQYSSLVATLPFAGLVACWFWARIPSGSVRNWSAAALGAALAAWCLLGWPAALSGFTAWRGTEMRRLLAEPAVADPAATVPALEFMHIERAKALQRAFNLH